MRISATARRYARALAQAAIHARPPRESTVGTELDGIWGYLRDRPAARIALESPVTTHERKKALVDAMEAAMKAGGAEMSAFTRRFLDLLVEESRFPLFRQVVEAYEAELDAFHGRLRVGVTTAQMPTDEEREFLRGTLQRTVAGGREVKLDFQVDPSLIAGAVVRVGSVVYDGSLESQLGELKQKLASESS